MREETMISRLEKSHGNIVGFKFHGKATDEDYKEHLIPQLEAAIEKHGKIRVLWDFEHFDGWTAHAAWDDMIAGTSMWSDFDRMAVVGDRKWEEVTMKLFQHLTGKFRYFDHHKLQHAWAWLEEE
jgi:hypothetical protein